MPELILGTAQFGQPYGIINNQSSIPVSEVQSILSLFAMHQGPKPLLDTASCYGSSESIIGQYIADYQLTPQVISKSLAPPDAIIASCQASRDRLNLHCLYGFLDHNAQALLGPSGDKAYYALRELKEKGVTQYIGASIYNSDEIDALLTRYPLDIIQLPINVFDQRLLQSGHLHKLYDQNIQIHARSIFLQGILLTPIERIPPSLHGLIPALNALEKTAYLHGVTRLAIILDFVFSMKMIEYIVIGVTSAKELQEILAYQHVQLCEDFSHLSFHNAELINPRQWTMKQS